MRRTLIAFASLVVVVPLAAQAEALHGKWRGVGDENQGEDLEFRADGTATTDGDRVRWTFVRDGQIRVTMGEEAIEMRYTLSGTRLTLILDESSYPYDRVGVVPPTGGVTGGPIGSNPLGGNPLGGNPLGGNPLAAPPAPDPFSREFRGEQIALSLTGSRSAGYSGTLEFRGTRYPASATAQADSLRGSFRVGDQAFEFSARLDGDAMTLDSGGTEYRLRGERVKANPLAGGGAVAAGGGGPAALEGVATAQGTIWNHPRGWFTFELPPGWSVWQQTEDGILLNPGFKETDSLDAIIALSFGRLEADERGVAIDQLLDSKESELRQQMASQGIELQKPEQRAQKVSVGEIPGAMQTWKGRAQSGASVDVWVGGLIKRDVYLAEIAILVDGKGDKFMPQIKRVFQTLRPTPPEANSELTRALVGRSFASSDNSGGNSFHCVYTFGSGGDVQKKMLFSGGEVGGSSEEPGTYEVVGDQVFLYFRDGQESGQVQQQGGQVTGLRFGAAVYRVR